jgi:IS5 family transposase
LLWDSVRVLVRLMGEASDEFGPAFNDHSRRAKRRTLAILTAGYMPKRVPLYRDLLKVTRKTVSHAERIADELDQVEPSSMMQAGKLGALARELRHFVKLANQVISQTERRVLDGESVPANEKIAGASGMVTDVVVESGNPNDATLAVKMIERRPFRKSSSASVF